MTNHEWPMANSAAGIRRPDFLASFPFRPSRRRVFPIDSRGLLMGVLVPLAQSTPDPRAAWAPVVLLIVIGVLFAAGTLILSVLIGPSRTGPGKEAVYESGMVPVGDARRRFNVRFYLLAVVFLVFDVAIVFFYPFAALFPDAVAQRLPATTVLLIEMLVFVAILLLAYIYAWANGVFRWD